MFLKEHSQLPSELRNLTPKIQTLRHNLREGEENDGNQRENSQEDIKYFSNDAKENLPESTLKTVNLSFQPNCSVR